MSILTCICSETKLKIVPVIFFLCNYTEHKYLIFKKYSKKLYRNQVSKQSTCPWVFHFSLIILNQVRELHWLTPSRKALPSYDFTRLLHNFLGHVIKSLPERGKPEFSSHQSAVRVPSAILKVLQEINGIWRAVSIIKCSWWMALFGLLFPADVTLSGSPLAHFFKPLGEPRIWNRTLTLSLFSPYVMCSSVRRVGFYEDNSPWWLGAV